MGNSFTQFANALRQGLPQKASELYYSDKKVRNAVWSRMNENLGEEYNDNTVLHFTAMLKMKELYCELIAIGGKPDMKNGNRRNCLHLLCVVGSRGGTEEEVREMMKYTLDYGLHGMDLQHVLEERDDVCEVIVRIVTL